MAPHHLPDASAQDLEIQRAGEMPGHGNIVGDGAGGESVEEPEPSLGEGERYGRAVRTPRDARLRGIPFHPAAQPLLQQRLLCCREAGAFLFKLGIGSHNGSSVF